MMSSSGNIETLEHVTISVIIPVYNELESLPDLLGKLRQALSAYEKWEILFLDDGSCDGTTEYLSRVASKTPGIYLVQLYQNYGKAAALTEGFKLAKGDYVVTMDGDLQDDPNEIPKLSAKLEEGYDLVSGWKEDRQDPWSRRFLSVIFNLVTRLVTGVKIHDFNCGLKIYRKAVAKTLDIYGGRHRFIPVLAEQKHFRVSEIKVSHRPRSHGKSKYGGMRLFHGLFDFLTILFLNRYTQQPFHFFGFIGFLAVSIGVLIDFYVLYLKYVEGQPFQQHMALLILGVLIIVVGVQLGSIGLLGEIVIRDQQADEKRIKRIVAYQSAE